MKKLFFVVFSLILCFSLFSEEKFRFKMSSDGEGLCIDKYLGNDDYVIIHSQYKGLPVKEIGGSAFSYSSVETVNIPDSVEIIEGNAFCACGNLRSITLPRKLKKVGYCAFSNCSNLSDMNIHTFGKVDFSESAFYHCSSLPESVQVKLIKLGYTGHF